MRALQIRRVPTPRASLTGLIAMAIDRYGVNGDQRPHAHPAAAPPARRGRTIGLTGSTPGISAPRMRPRVWCVLEVQPIRTTTRALVRPSGPPPPRMSGPPFVVRPSAYAPGEVPTPTHQAAPPPSLLRSPRVGSLAPLRPPAPVGTSRPCWAASAGSLKAHRRPPGRPPWGSWTPHPIYGVCVTTPLPRCLNGVRDH